MQVAELLGQLRMLIGPGAVLRKPILALPYALLGYHLRCGWSRRLHSSATLPRERCEQYTRRAGRGRKGATDCLLARLLARASSARAEFSSGYALSKRGVAGAGGSIGRER
jgi:hypothetical protein